MLDVKLTPSQDGVQIGPLTVTFMRTLRIPDDGRQHPLPPGLGTFPVRRMSDYADRVPASWARHGGVFFPIHEREAMWMDFEAPEHDPVALKVAVGMVNAITGKPWSEPLDETDQDYVVVPDQPWLDGIKTEGESVRQFVAMPLGSGATVEGQLTGNEECGGLQLLALAAKPGAVAPRGIPDFDMGTHEMLSDACMAVPALDMGIAAGGRMRQQIYEDSYGIEVWDPTNTARVYVHMCNAELWQAITGEEPPAEPRELEGYDGPWFDVDDAGYGVVPGSTILDGVKSVDELDEAASTTTANLKSKKVVVVPTPGKLPDPSGVRDGDW